MKVGIYCRVSTENQKGKDKVSLDRQERLGVEYCEKNKYDYEVYSEVVSGASKTIDREEFFKLESKLFSKEINAIWFYDWDRMIRDFEIGFYFKKLVEDTQCKVFVLDREYNIFDDADNLEYGIRVIFSDYERRKIRNRMIGGKVEKWREGKGFSGQVGIGYTRKDGYVVIDDKESKIIKDVYKYFLRKDVKKYTQVLERVRKKYGDENGKIKGISHTGRVRDILSDKKYLGVYTITDQNGVDWDFNFGRIIEDEVFEEVQKKMQYVTSLRRGNAKYEYLLKGKVRCSDCGGSMVVRGGGTPKDKGGRGKGYYKYYFCSKGSKAKYDYIHNSLDEKLKYTKDEIREKVCISVDTAFNNIGVDKLETIIWKGLKYILTQSDYIKSEYKTRFDKNLGLKEDNKGRLVVYKERLRTLERDREKVLDDYVTGKLDVDDYNMWKKNHYEAKKKEINKRIVDLENEMLNTNDIEKFDDFVDVMLKDLDNRFKNKRFSHRRRLISQYVDYIDVRRKDANSKKYSVYIRLLFEDKVLKDNELIVNENGIDLFFIKNSKYESLSFNKKHIFGFGLDVDVFVLNNNENVVLEKCIFDF